MTSIFSSQNLQTLRRRKYCFLGPPGGPPPSRLGPELGRPAFLEFPLGAGMFYGSFKLGEAAPRPAARRPAWVVGAGQGVWLSAFWPRALPVALCTSPRASTLHPSARQEI